MMRHNEGFIKLLRSEGLVCLGAAFDFLNLFFALFVSLLYFRALLEVADQSTSRSYKHVFWHIAYVRSCLLRIFLLALSDHVFGDFGRSLVDSVIFCQGPEKMNRAVFVIRVDPGSLGITRVEATKGIRISLQAFHSASFTQFNVNTI
jgi:hypothetical protein